MSSKNSVFGSTATFGTFGYNNVAIGYNNSTSGPVGISGHNGISGVPGVITDWKEDMMKKYPRFTIKTEYDPMTFSPTNIIIDNTTGEEYEFTPTNISNIVDETDKYIQSLINIIRDEKITNLLNDTKD
jgi:hypothetical protein